MRQQLGRAVSILLQEQRACDEEYEDMRAFHAPSECGPIVARGQARRFRQVRRHACHIARVKNLRALRAKVLHVCPTWDRYNHHRLGVEAI